MKSLTLYEAYQLATSGIDYSEFEQIIKSKLTGKPITVIIDEDVTVRITEPARPSGDIRQLEFMLDAMIGAYKNGGIININNEAVKVWDLCNEIIQHHTPTDQSAPVEVSAEIIEFLQGIIGIKNLLEYPSDTKEEHKEEAKAVSAMLRKAESLLDQYATSVNSAQVQDGEK